MLLQLMGNDTAFEKPAVDGNRGFGLA